MSREIKFRFWDIQNKKWTEGMGIYDDGIIGDFSECFHNIAGDNGEFYIAQQFTGLIDKNGVRVYEGDIVSWSEYQGWEDGRTFHGLYQVIWDQENLRYDFFDPFESAYWPLADTKFDQVVGNIFEHPELLTHEP